MKKSNPLFRLDLLEAKYEGAYPRYRFTKKLLNAKNNAAIMRKMPSSEEEAKVEMAALKAEASEKNMHGSYTKLLREVKKRVKTDLRLWKDEALEEFFNKPENVELLVCSKLVKILIGIYKNVPASYIPKDYADAMSDKQNQRNPSNFFKAYCLDNKSINGYISTLWNQKEFKELLSEIDWSFRRIRGNLTKEERQEREKFRKGKKSELEDSDEESEDEAVEADMQFLAFDNLVASDDSSDEDKGMDSEPETASRYEAKPELTETKPKPKLPQLATGYFSGGSDDEDDIDNDEVVKAATTQRKNRRGQRARQKIWEAKYGKKANHVQKERDRVQSERERKQREFEERQRKRELKAKEQPQNQEPEKKKQKAELHPSWVAKKAAEAKTKGAKFEGKKITFD